MELRQYILESINDLLRDAVSEEGRTLVKRDACQLVDHMDAKYEQEQRQQILALLRGETSPDMYSAEIASEAESLLGWFKAMRATANRKPLEKDHLAELYAPSLINPAFLITLSAPLSGGIGWFLGLQWLFWIGVGLALLTLFLNLASGVLKLPVLPALLIIIAASLITPWYVGAAAGLLTWTGLELMGEIFGRVVKSNAV